MRLSNRMALLLACFSLVLPQLATAGERTAQPQVTDVSLRADGVLVGHVVNSQGEAVSAAKVTVYHGRNVVAQTTSDRNGGFLVRKLRGGVHQVVTGQNATTVRLWTTKAAPPASRTSLTIVDADKGLVRAQSGDGFLGMSPNTARTAGLITAGLVIGGIVWAVADDDDDNFPKSL
jgi:hypothetical protein